MLRLPVVIFTVGLFTAATSAAELGSPNVVVILADDMGFGDVHALNPDSAIPTPNLDRLANKGITFTDGHSPSAVCTPTRYGLLTGRYCWRTRLKRGVLGGYSPPLLEKDRPTIGTILQRAGYKTAAVGKWHLGMALPMRDGGETQSTKFSGDPGVDFAAVISDSPIHHGFGDYFGVTASLDMAPYVFVRNDRFTMLPTIQQPAVKFPHFVRQGPRAADFEIDQVLDKLTEEAVEFVTTAAQGDKPFFLYMPLTAPHKPAQPHKRFRGNTQLGEYGDFVTQVDWTVGRVMRALDESKVADRTLVFYTSDNGSYMHRYDGAQQDHVDKRSVQGYRRENHRANGPFRGTKADIWEAGHHVPLLVRWPGHAKSGTKCQEPVCLTDLFATLAEIVEVRLDNDVAEDSFSLASMIQGKPGLRGGPVIHHSAGGMFAIRDGKWKLVLGNGSGGRENPKGKPFAKPYQLFDMSADIGETTNLAATKPEVVERLTSKLNSIRSRGRSVNRL